MQPDTFDPPNDALQQLNDFWGNGDHALKALYQQGFFNVERFVMNNKGTAEQAKDIYQDAFLAVWRNVQLGRFTPQNESALPGYLYQVAKNKWIDYLRSGYHKNTVRTNDIEKDYEPVDELPAEQSDYINKIKKGLQMLGDNCKELLGRYYYKNESLRTIAAAFNWTEATARNNKYRCIEKLRASVKK
ncbi:MAG: sigma-70 family RNA polymerase sigma factor [Bacteroidota bacterium]